MNNKYGTGLVEHVEAKMNNFCEALASGDKAFFDLSGRKWVLVRTDSRGRKYWRPTHYKSKTSSRTIREQHERDSVLQSRMAAEGRKAELMCLVYGGIPVTDDGKLLVAGMKAGFQRELQAHTSAGDFSHLAGNPLILK